MLDVGTFMFHNVSVKQALGDLVCHEIALANFLE